MMLMNNTLFVLMHYYRVVLPLSIVLLSISTYSMKAVDDCRSHDPPSLFPPAFLLLPLLLLLFPLLLIKGGFFWLLLILVITAIAAV